MDWLDGLSLLWVAIGGGVMLVFFLLVRAVWGFLQSFLFSD